MPDEKPGFQILPPSESFEVTESTVDGDYFRADIPVFDGIQVQVQRPLGVAEPTREPGVLGMAITSLNNEPHVFLNIRHPDGTSLSAVMGIEDFAALGSLFTSTIRRLELFGMPGESKQ